MQSNDAAHSRGSSQTYDRHGASGLSSIARLREEFEDLSNVLRSLKSSKYPNETLVSTAQAEVDAQRKRLEDVENREAERREAKRREAKRQEAERREAEKIELEKREAAKREVAKREAARREAAKTEAAKREAERKKAEQREAKAREANQPNQKEAEIRCYNDEGDTHFHRYGKNRYCEFDSNDENAECAIARAMKGQKASEQPQHKTAAAHVLTTPSSAIGGDETLSANRPSSNSARLSQMPRKALTQDATMLSTPSRPSGRADGGVNMRHSGPTLARIPIDLISSSSPVTSHSSRNERRAKKCYVCKGLEDKAHNRLVQCRCGKLYHTACHKPAVPKTRNPDWQCYNCVAKYAGSKRSKPSSPHQDGVIASSKRRRTELHAATGREDEALTLAPQNVGSLPEAPKIDISAPRPANQPTLHPPTPSGVRAPTRQANSIGRNDTSPNTRHEQSAGAAQPHGGLASSLPTTSAQMPGQSKITNQTKSLTDRGTSKPQRGVDTLGLISEQHLKEWRDRINEPCDGRYFPQYTEDGSFVPKPQKGSGPASRPHSNGQGWTLEGKPLILVDDILPYAMEKFQELMKIGNCERWQLHEVMLNCSGLAQGDAEEAHKIIFQTMHPPKSSRPTPQSNEAQRLGPSIDSRTGQAYRDNSQVPAQLHNSGTSSSRKARAIESTTPVRTEVTHGGAENAKVANGSTQQLSPDHHMQNGNYPSVNRQGSSHTLVNETRREKDTPGSGLPTQKSQHERAEAATGTPCPPKKLPGPGHSHQATSGHEGASTIASAASSPLHSSRGVVQGPQEQSPRTGLPTEIPASEPKSDQFSRDCAKPGCSEPLEHNVSTNEHAGRSTDTVKSNKDPEIEALRRMLDSLHENFSLKKFRGFLDGATSVTLRLLAEAAADVQGWPTSSAKEAAKSWLEESFAALSARAAARSEANEIGSGSLHGSMSGHLATRGDDSSHRQSEVEPMRDARTAPALCGSSNHGAVASNAHPEQNIFSSSAAARTIRHFRLVPVSEQAAVATDASDSQAADTAGKHEPTTSTGDSHVPNSIEERVPAAATNDHQAVDRVREPAAAATTKNVQAAGPAQGGAATGPMKLGSFPEPAAPVDAGISQSVQSSTPNNPPHDSVGPRSPIDPPSPAARQKNAHKRWPRGKPRGKKPTSVPDQIADTVDPLRTQAFDTIDERTASTDQHNPQAPPSIEHRTQAANTNINHAENTPEPAPSGEDHDTATSQTNADNLDEHSTSRTIHVNAEAGTSPASRPSVSKLSTDDARQSPEHARANASAAVKAKPKAPPRAGWKELMMTVLKAGPAAGLTTDEVVEGVMKNNEYYAQGYDPRKLKSSLKSTLSQWNGKAISKHATRERGRTGQTLYQWRLLDQSGAEARQSQQQVLNLDAPPGNGEGLEDGADLSTNHERGVTPPAPGQHEGENRVPQPEHARVASPSRETEIPMRNSHAFDDGDRHRRGGKQWIIASNHSLLDGRHRLPAEKDRMAVKKHPTARQRVWSSSSNFVWPDVRMKSVWDVPEDEGLSDCSDTPPYIVEGTLGYREAEQQIRVPVKRKEKRPGAQQKKKKMRV